MDPLLATAMLYGLLFGSFLNVLIARLPGGETLMGRSRCPHCEVTIRPYDLVPVVSFLLLGARCRNCRAGISWRYPLVEILTCLLAGAVVLRFGYGLEAVASFVFGAALIVVTFIDYDHQIIPDVITLPGVVLALGVRLFLAGGDWLPWVVGVVAGAGGLWLVAIAYQRVAGREGLGLGDVKLAALLGAFLGGSGVFLTIFLASIIGSLVGGALIALGRGNRTTALPFGSFLAPIGVLVLFYGPTLVGWYLGHLRLGG